MEDTSSSLFPFFPPVFADWLWKLRERWVTKHPWSLPYCAASPADILNSNSEFPHPPQILSYCFFPSLLSVLFFMFEFLLGNFQLPSAIELLCLHIQSWHHIRFLFQSVGSEMSQCSQALTCHNSSLWQTLLLSCHWNVTMLFYHWLFRKQGVHQMPYTPHVKQWGLSVWCIFITLFVCTYDRYKVWLSMCTTLYIYYTNLLSWVRVFCVTPSLYSDLQHSWWIFALESIAPLCVTGYITKGIFCF